MLSRLWICSLIGQDYLIYDEIVICFVFVYSFIMFYSFMNLRLNSHTVAQLNKSYLKSVCMKSLSGSVRTILICSVCRSQLSSQCCMAEV